MKLFLTLVAFLFAFTTFGQVIKYKTINQSIKEGQEAPKRSELEALVVYNIDKSKVRIFTAKEQNFDLIELVYNDTTEDGSGIIKYVGVDDDGVKCKIEIFLFKDPKSNQIASLKIEYSNRIYRYALRDNN